MGLIFLSSWYDLNETCDGMCTRWMLHCNTCWTVTDSYEFEYDIKGGVSPDRSGVYRQYSFSVSAV